MMRTAYKASQSRIHHVGAFAGVLLGGRLADLLAKKSRQNRLYILSAALLFGAPFIYWMAMGDTLTTVYVALFLFGVFRGVYDSNIFASLPLLIESQWPFQFRGKQLLPMHSCFKVS